MVNVVTVGGFLRVVLRPLEEVELVQVWELCDHLQWMVSLQDLRDVYAAKPLSFIGAFDQQYNALIGVVSATPLDRGQGYISLFMVSEMHQGRGVGRILLSEAMYALRDYNIHLDASPGTQELYQKFGFHAADKHNFLIEGYAKVIPNYTFPRDLDIVKVTTSNVTTIMNFDKQVSRIDRSDHLPEWLLSKCSNAYAAYQKGRCVGFGATRQCNDFYKIQPLYAENLNIAIALVQKLLTSDQIPCKASVVFYPVVENLNQTLALAWRFGATELSPVGRCMYTGKALVLPWRSIYSRTNKLNTII